METLDSLGKILPTGHQQSRDAVHIAVMPVVAGDDLCLGQRLRLAFGTTSMVLSGDRNHDDYIGIVDPFLERGPRKGQEFFMWLRPGTINSLRHEWRHPTIDAANKKPISEAERWLRAFASKWNFDYDEMIAASQEEDGYVTARGIDLHSASELDYGDEDLFWQHIETLTGQEFNAERKSSFMWSCSC